MTYSVHGVWRGLQQVSYENDQYRSTVKNVDREPVLVSVNVLTMRGAIRESNDLALHYQEFGL
jgi:hypothetical protein